MDHSFRSSSEERAEIEVENCYGLISFSSTRSFHHVYGSTHFASPFSERLRWPAFWFYVTRFYV